jgi:hypothetical protein
MPLKIYSPDIQEHPKNHTHISIPLYHLYYPHLSQQELIHKMGDWVTKVKMVDNIHECDIMMPATQVNRYYETGRLAYLQTINNEAAAAGKLTVCWTSGDEGITPQLKNFHLYRSGGYASKNRGNQFVSSMYINDPLNRFFSGELKVHASKSSKPVIGFCGQGRSSIYRASKEILQRTSRHILKAMGKWIYDTEKIESTTQMRSNILGVLEKSSLVTTNFIRHEKYRGGVKTKEEKEASTIAFYKNIQETEYTVCYRGAGNFSIRFYETLAMGRIPIIVTSDNNLPFPELIDWSIFPMTSSKRYKQIDKMVASFHNALSHEQFVALQQAARSIYVNYISYPGFMDKFVNRYIKD